VTEDDLDAIQSLDIDIEMLLSVRFEKNMNILNFAIDNESVEIVCYLAELLKDRPEEKKFLVQHRFGNNSVQAVHQVMSVGNRILIEVVI
jgi:hypothetical protein